MVFANWGQETVLVLAQLYLATTEQTALIMSRIYRVQCATDSSFAEVFHVLCVNGLSVFNCRLSHSFFHNDRFVTLSFVLVNESDVSCYNGITLQALQDSAHGFTCVVNACTMCGVYVSNMLT